MSSKEHKLRRGLKMEQAIRERKEGFVLMEILDEAIEKIESIKPTDVSEIVRQLEEVKQKIEEPIEVDLVIE